MAEEPDRLARIAAPHATVAGKIRALAAAGVPRADIARFLGKRYQHVRNVLEDDAQAGGGYVIGRADLSGLREEPAEFHGPPPEPSATEAGVAVLRLPLGEDGSVKLPPLALAQLGLRPGGVAIAELEGERLTIFSARESVRRVQALVRDLVPGDHSLADALLADRRKDAAAEDD